MKRYLLSLVLLMGVLSVANAQQIVWGDMNDDGNLSMQDANAVVNIYVTGGTPTTLNFALREDYEYLLHENEMLKEELSKYKSSGTHKGVDLGLSVKWATNNVGADEPEEYGDYFAWGEVEPKSEYTWANYKWCNESEYALTKYCADSKYGTVDGKSVLDLTDDVAHVKWGGTWRMPTIDEMKELVNKCTWKWVTQNKVKGYKVTGPNGNYIFLPAAGYYIESAGFTDAGTDGGYWSSSLVTVNSSVAWGFMFYSDYSGTEIGNRSDGQCVRPVCP